jgi:Flp pilus assembly pilin Flp
MGVPPAHAPRGEKKNTALALFQATHREVEPTTISTTVKRAATAASELKGKHPMSYLAKARARLNGMSLVRDERGLSTVEYVIILVLIAAIAIGTWKTFGGKVQSGLKNASEQFDENVTQAELQDE